VFLRDAQAKDGAAAVAGLDQPMRIGAIAYGTAFEEQWGVAGRKVDFFDAKGDVEVLLGPVLAEAQFVPAVHPALHPGRSAQVVLRGSPVGWVGELHPAWLAKYELPGAPVVFELDLAAIAARSLPAYRELSKFPAVVRDLAVVVAESVSAQSLLETMKSCSIAISHELQLFDVYRGKGIEQGQKSLAFRVVMQDTAKTLTDEEADSVTAQLIAVLATRHGAKLRT
jgi:phenylalanyl-tRNA synthetase beta chain